MTSKVFVIFDQPLNRDKNSEHNLKGDVELEKVNNHSDDEHNQEGD